MIHSWKYSDSWTVKVYINKANKDAWELFLKEKKKERNITRCADMMSHNTHLSTSLKPRLVSLQLPLKSYEIKIMVMLLEAEDNPISLLNAGYRTSIDSDYQPKCVAYRQCKVSKVVKIILSATTLVCVGKLSVWCIYCIWAPWPVEKCLALTKERHKLTKQLSWW